jgi:hypothetical protein
MPRFALLLICSLVCAAALAAEPRKVEYVPPEGFGVHE